jgi:hypothetical protein
VLAGIISVPRMRNRLHVILTDNLIIISTLLKFYFFLEEGLLVEITFLRKIIKSVEGNVEESGNTNHKDGCKVEVSCSELPKEQVEAFEPHVL